MLVAGLQVWQCLSVCLSNYWIDCHDWLITGVQKNKSSACCQEVDIWDSYLLQTLKFPRESLNFSDPLPFPLAPPSGQDFHSLWGAERTDSRCCGQRHWRQIEWEATGRQRVWMDCSAHMRCIFPLMIMCKRNRSGSKFDMPLWILSYFFFCSANPHVPLPWGCMFIIVRVYLFQC